MNKLYNYLVKDGDAIAVGVSAVLFAVFALGIYLGSSSGGYSLSELTNMEDLSQINCFNPGLWTMIWMFFIASAVIGKSIIPKSKRKDKKKRLKAILII
jgi:Ni/Fe-hydrogenase subunit HybB-like protein